MNRRPRKLAPPSDEEYEKNHHVITRTSMAWSCSCGAGGSMQVDPVSIQKHMGEDHPQKWGYTLK